MIKAQQKGQRVAVLVDVQNMYYSARYAYDQRVNFKHVLEEAVQKRVLTRAIAYAIQTEDLKNEPFFDALEKQGFEVKTKDLQVFSSGAKKGDWDVGIAMDAIRLARKVDTIILVSGDGDFRPLVQHLQHSFGCRVEAMAFGKSASHLLKSVVDQFTDLDEQSEKFLIKRKTKKSESTKKSIRKKTGGSKK
ncbi:NYN domain-containing protein [Candidatus Woesearchaeota archaeon]|nr:NYN domain-containing protein [Candidatus Woesearchaeota archaeon]